MSIVNTHYGFCAKGGAAPKFTYTGNYNVRDDGVVELLTSGTLVFLNPAVIDIFCVGGGGAGGLPSASSSSVNTPCGGGGGGYTATTKKQSVAGNYTVTIGAGATLGEESGGATSFGSLISANGGLSVPYLGSNKKWVNGANGGSGGGGARFNTNAAGTGGYDGGNGGNGSSTYSGGVGQGTTTREFGEETGKLYAGGGGGGTQIASSTPVVANGGAGGGGTGCWINVGATTNQAATAGVANTGGGGGGGARGQYISPYAKPGTGGSGIVCFRAAK